MQQAATHDELVETMTGGMVSAIEPFQGSDRLRSDGRPRGDLRNKLRLINGRRNAFTCLICLALPVAVITGVVLVGHWIAVVVAVPIIGVLQVRMFILSHEGAHRLLFTNRRLNDFIGITIFLVPFTCVIIYFAFMYTYDSWTFNRDAACAWWQCGEISASLVGLSHRWLIKGVLVFGLVVALLAGIAVWLQVAIALFGPKHWRFDLMTIEWPEESGASVEGKERMELEKMDDQLELQSARMRAAAEAEKARNRE